MSAITPAQWQQVQRLLDELEALAPERRQQALAALTIDDPLVRSEAASLLQAEARQAGFMAEPLLVQTPRAEAASLAPGTRLGVFEVESLIGRGGMAEVYRARRVGDFNQVVAIKLVLESAPARLEYFQRERRIVAALEHPGIARLIDGDVTPAGRPYMVMEYVEGTDLVRHAQQQRLDLRGRLELFRQVCEAVSFAHLHLVIHRDLKPANIQVTQQGRVKLLDFGVAKLIEAERRSDDFDTATVLTPEFAAPEQLYGEQVTAATDVYALGAVLYQLLAGAPAFETRGMPLHLAIDQLLRSDAPALSVAAARQAEPPIPPRLLRGDLDAIVQRAMRRKPTERYASVQEFWSDLGRHLDHQPVYARRGSTQYLLSRLVRRHRVGVAAAAVSLAAVLAGLAVALWQAQRAAGEAQRSERVKDFLVDVFEQADPGANNGDKLTAESLLVHSTERVAADLADEPLVQADLYLTLGGLRARLGQYEQSLELSDRALAIYQAQLGEDDERAARGELLRGSVLVSTRRHAEVAAALERATRLFERNPQSQILPLAEARRLLASAYIGLDRRDEGRASVQAAYEEVLKELGPTHAETAKTQLELAQILEVLADYEPAERHYRGALKAFEALYGTANPQIAAARRDLGGLLDRTGRTREAELELREAARTFREIYGDQHPDYGTTLFSLAILLTGERRFAEADQALLETLRIFPEDGERHAQSLRYLGGSYLAQQRFGEAEETLRRSWLAYGKVADRATQQQRALADLGTAIMRQGRVKEAEPMLRQAVARLQELGGVDSYDLRNPLKRLGECLVLLPRTAEAVSMLTRARALEVKLLGENHRDLAGTDYWLGTALLESADAPALLQSRELVDRAVAAERPRQRPEEFGRLLLLSARIAQTQADTNRARDELKLAQPLLTYVRDQKLAQGLGAQIAATQL